MGKYLGFCFGKHSPRLRVFTQEVLFPAASNATNTNVSEVTLVYPRCALPPFLFIRMKASFESAIKPSFHPRHGRNKYVHYCTTTQREAQTEAGRRRWGRLQNSFPFPGRPPAPRLLAEPPSEQR